MSVHPLSKVPADRLRTWPLTTLDRVALQVCGIGLNPAALILLPLLLIAAARPLAVYLLASSFCNSLPDCLPDAS